MILHFFAMNFYKNSLSLSLANNHILSENFFSGKEKRPGSAPLKVDGGNIVSTFERSQAAQKRFRQPDYFIQTEKYDQKKKKSHPADHVAVNISLDHNHPPCEPIGLLGEL
jgi:hypothetical protein